MYHALTKHIVLKPKKKKKNPQIEAYSRKSEEFTLYTTIRGTGIIAAKIAAVGNHL